MYGSIWNIYIDMPKIERYKWHALAILTTKAYIEKAQLRMNNSRPNRNSLDL